MEIMDGKSLSHSLSGGKQTDKENVAIVTVTVSSF